MHIVEVKPNCDSSRSNQGGRLHAKRFRAVGVVALGLLRFTLHFAEMWFAMLFGTMVFGYARHGLAIVGVRTLLDPVSIQSEVGHGIFMTAPMVLWMLIRGYRWRENIEMALGMIVPWAAVIASARFGAKHGLPWLSERNAMAAGMLAVMLYHASQGRLAPVSSR